MWPLINFIFQRTSFQLIPVSTAAALRSADRRVSRQRRRLAHSQSTFERVFYSQQFPVTTFVSNPSLF